MRPFLIPLLCLSALPNLVCGQQNDEFSEGGFGFSKQKIMTRQLENARAEEVISILNELFPVKFSANPKTNTIYARATEEQITEVNEIVDQMEERIAEVNKADDLRKRSPGRGGLGALGSGGAGISRPRGSIPGGSQLAGPPKKPESPSGLAMAASRFTKDLDLDFDWIERDLVPLVIELSKVETEFGAEHPRVRVIKKQIESVRETLLKSLEASRKGRIESRPSTKFAAQLAAIETEVSKVIAELRSETAKELPADELEKVKAGLTESVGRLFDVRQQAEEADLKQFNEQLENIRKRLDERKENRDKIVQGRVEELLKEGSGK